MRTLFTFICLTSLVPSYAQSPRLDVVNRIQKEPLDCRRIPNMKRNILKQMGKAVKCRFEPRDVQCPPGLTLRVDVTNRQDMCLRADGRPLSAPKCTTVYREKYRQEIVQRGHFLVEKPNNKSRWEWLDLPFSFASRLEVLAQEAPVKLLGRDACVYMRNPLLLLGRQKQADFKSPPEK